MISRNVEIKPPIIPCFAGIVVLTDRLYPNETEKISHGIQSTMKDFCGISIINKRIFPIRNEIKAINAPNKPS